MKMGMGCVYFIRLIGLKPVKIGYSTHPTPASRVKQANTYAPLGVEVLSFICSAKPKRLEKVILRELSESRLRGEWFDITDEDVKSIISKYIVNELSISDKIGDSNEFSDFFIRNLKIDEPFYIYPIMIKFFNNKQYISTKEANTFISNLKKWCERNRLIYENKPKISFREDLAIVKTRLQ